jgi:hypothetical protein
MMLIRTCHPCGFRSGEWASLKGTVEDPDTGRLCYAVMFADGAGDFWMVADPDGRYEFAMATKDAPIPSSSG